MMEANIRWVVTMVLIAVLRAGKDKALGQTNPAPTAMASAIRLTSPLDYQVFQRTERLHGKVEIRGRTSVSADRAEARLTGTSLTGPLPEKWFRLHFERHTGEFRASVKTVPGGFYHLEVKVLRHGVQVAETDLPHVGLGEVFVVSGQSNSTNYGESRQQTSTRMVVAFDGNQWRIADDPQPGVQDDSSQGSFIPAFGDSLYAHIHVPIGVAAVGHGSTSVRQWLPSGERVYVMPTMTRFVTHNAADELVSDGYLFNGMMERTQQLGRHGFRALLWHQGESDAHQAPNHQISPEMYTMMMKNVIDASRRRIGWKFPWLVATATYHSPTDPSAPEIANAQEGLWRKRVAIAGANTDLLGKEYRENHGAGVHFSDTGLKAHGQLWASAVEAYLDRVLF